MRLTASHEKIKAKTMIVRCYSYEANEENDRGTPGMYKSQPFYVR